MPKWVPSDHQTSFLIILIQNYHEHYPTPEIAPIDHDTTSLKLTPFLNGLIDIAEDHLDQFYLDPTNFNPSESRRVMHRGDRLHQRHRSNSLVEFHLDNDLQDIIEESDFEINSLQEFDSFSQSAEWDDKYDSDGEVDRGIEPDQLKIDTENKYLQKIERYVKDPKVTLLQSIRKLAEVKCELNQKQKLENIKKTIENYIMEFQMPSFDEAWQELTLPFKQKIDLVTKGIQQNFKKTIGNLNFEDRRLKLLKYIKKKRMRRWRKDISYDCRKKVADSRLRIKGKFVTRKQVCSQLGISDIDNYTGDEIKELLEKKTEESKQKNQ